MKLNVQLVGRCYGPFSFTASQDSILMFNRAVDAPDNRAHPAYAACFNQKPFSVALRDPELNLDFSRLLHAGQRFEFFSVIGPGSQIVTDGRIENIYAKGDLKFVVVASESRSPDGVVLLRGLYTGVVK